MKKLFIYLIINFVIVSYSGQTLDLSTIKLGENSENLKIEKYNFFEKEEQNGHYEGPKLVPGSELTIKYSCNFGNNHQVNYEGIPGNEDSEPIKIIIYNNKIASYKFNADKKELIKLTRKLLKKLGKPSGIISNNTTAEKNEISFLTDVKKLFPNEFHWEIMDGTNSQIYNVTYPSIIIWENDNSYHLLNFNFQFKDYNATYSPVTKEAFRDNVIFGHLKPPANSPLSKYVK
ncbi:hypothetical protein [Apibacter sp. HY039]|uniref:hypothetical protein n=1 Tax=Apibacter sp. HY039 TaxID=2501476 RepID=UPI000FEBD487|nr:hypothetical protein [Apibacter sp. HY039]